MKKRVLHFISGLGVGGAEMQLLRILPELQNEFDNRVCCLRGQGEIGKKLEEKGIKVYYLKITNIFQLMRFRKVTKEFHPDMLVTYLIHADLTGRILGKIFGIGKIICSQRGVLLNWEFLRFFDRLTKSLVTKYIVQTEAAKKELAKKLNLKEEKFEIIPNCINLEDYDFDLNEEKKKSELGINHANINIVCVSNLRRDKGHEYLLEAFEEVFKVSENMNLLIVGDGEKKEKLINQVKNYRSKHNIFFLGKRNDVKEILKISDIFILPTLGEGMSNAIMEAMASAMPVITTNIPVNAEIIENSITGILVNPKQSKELSEKMQFLIKNPEIRKKLGSNSKKLIENKFTISKISSKWTEVLKAL